MKGGINVGTAVDEIIAEAMEIGMRRGAEEAKKIGIRRLIELCKELGASYENTQFQIEMRYDIKETDARSYMEQYWNE